MAKRYTDPNAKSAGAGIMTEHRQEWRSMAYLGFAFFIPVVIMYLIYLAMEIHPFGDGSVLVLDLNGQYVYFYEALRHFVCDGDTSLLYSFFRSLGGDFMGIYAYYIASPFSYIVCLFPQEKILDALLLIFLLKTGLCGFTFGFFIHKTGRSKSRIATVIFSMMYALSAYAVVQQHNSMWIDAVMWLPIISYAIEQLIKYGKFRMYVIFLSLTLMSNFYIGYMVCYYVIAYFFYYYFAYNRDNLNNPLCEKRHFIKSFVRFGGYSLLSVGVAAVVVLLTYYSLTFGKTTFTNPSWAFNFKFDLIDLLIKFLPGSYDTVRPEGLPFVYCGMLTIILLPVYFLSSKFTVREKVAAGAVIAFFVLSFSISTVDLVWHGFQRPNWLNYRYSFMLCFLVLMLACSAFSELKSVSSKTIFAICTSLAALVVFIQTLDREYVSDLETIWFSLACIASYLVLICILKVTKFRDNILLIITFFVSFELFANGLTNVVDLNRDVVYSKYSSYTNFMAQLRPIVRLVQENDTSFYRMEKTIHRKTNDNMALKIRGLSNSTSTLNSSTIAFLNRMGYCSLSHWGKYAGGTPVNDSLLGLKYIITPANEDLSDYYTRAYAEGGFTAWYNRYALSIAYGVDDKITGIVANDYEAPCDYLNALVSAMLGEEEIIEIFVPIEVENVTTSPLCQRSYIAGHHKYAKASEDAAALVYYTFTAPNDREVFFYPPSDYPREVSLKVNGMSKGSFYGSDTSRIVSLGKFNEGETVVITMTLVNNDLYVKNGYDCLYYIDWAAFEDAMSRLAQVQYNIVEYTERSFKGTLTSPRDNQIIQTTLPFDEGWKIYVDGQKVEIFETLDALVAFRVDAGEHTIEMKYLPDLFVLGFAITVFSVLLGILLFVLNKKIIIRKPAASDNPAGNEGETNDIAGDFPVGENSKDIDAGSPDNPFGEMPPDAEFSAELAAPEINGQDDSFSKAVKVKTTCRKYRLNPSKPRKYRRYSGRR